MLQSLKLDGCPVTTAGLKATANCLVSLKELSLSKCIGVTDDGLSSIVMIHSSLRKLDITCCRKITCVSLANITNSCPNLTSLRMESCSLVPKEAFIMIGRCQILQELDLTNNEVDDEGLFLIIPQHLLELNLHQVYIKHNLAYTNWLLCFGSVQVFILLLNVRNS